VYCKRVETFEANRKDSPSRLGNYLSALRFKSHKKQSLGFDNLRIFLHMSCVATTILPGDVTIPTRAKRSIHCNRLIVLRVMRYGLGMVIAPLHRHSPPEVMYETDLRLTGRIRNDVHPDDRSGSIHAIDIIHNSH
jgi:hypothetical protein